MAISNTSLHAPIWKRYSKDSLKTIRQVKVTSPCHLSTRTQSHLRTQRLCQRSTLAISTCTREKVSWKSLPSPARKLMSNLTVDVLVEWGSIVNPQKSHWLSNELTLKSYSKTSFRLLNIPLSVVYIRYLSSYVSHSSSATSSSSSSSFIVPKDASSSSSSSSLSS